MLDTMEGLKRTKYCGDVTAEDIGKELVVCGWAARQRNLGNLIFIDLRDRTGILQLSFNDSTDRTVFEKATGVRGEFVLMAKGTLRKRESVNPELKTGEVELFVDDLRILSKAQTPPFEILDDIHVKDELRLKHRYLDLRRKPMQDTLLMRHKIVKVARDYYDQNGFLELETPILIKSTPEGARDYLVPSRVHPGSFYALPQSPQLYKQLLMCSGFDRYMQVARCFRDEDLRADRQPEFTQIDLEMSFVEAEDVMAMNEGFIRTVFKEVLGVDVQTPFARMPYEEAMEQYGSDKPDTRFEMKLTDLTPALLESTFKVFAGAIADGGAVRAINAKGLAAKLTRKEIDKLVDFVKTYGAKGLAYTRITEEATSSSFEKFLTPAEVEAIHTKAGLEAGDVLLVVADADQSVVFAALGALRCEIAKKYGLIPEGQFNFLWVYDFPLFEKDKETGRLVAMHHPFTSVKDSDLPLLESAPEKAHAKAYDMVLNGCELGGGSVRISNPELQSQMFKLLGFTPERAQEQFGFLLDAFTYGVPPHAGMAYGLDRLVMLMAGKDSIRDVIAFPKVQNASDLMSRCPSPVDPAQLEELSIVVTAEEETPAQ